jgi:hypothetical protein
LFRFFKKSRLYVKANLYVSVAIGWLQFRLFVQIANFFLQFFLRKYFKNDNIGPCCAGAAQSTGSAVEAANIAPAKHVTIFGQGRSVGKHSLLENFYAIED